MNEQFAKNHKIPAVVLDMGIPGLAIARSLGRKNIPVIGVDYVSNTLRLSSKFWQPALMSERNFSENLAEFLIELGKDFVEKAVLFPCHDDYVLFISRYRDILSNKYRFLLPAKDLIEQIVNKQQFYNLATAHGLTIPATFYPQNESDVKTISKSIQYPCIIKPIYSQTFLHPAIMQRFGYRKVFKFQSAEQLYKTYSELAMFNREVLIQEIVSGKDDQLYQIVSYMNNKGDILASFTGRKKRIFPTEFGVGCFVESVERIPELEENSTRFLQEISYRGLSGIEFKWDKRKKQYVLIEMNARFILWAGLGSHCGVDVAELAYRDLTGIPTQEQYSYRTGVKWANTETDFSAFLEYRRKRELTFWRWLISYRPPITFALFAWNDQKAFWHRAKQLIGIFGTKLKSLGKQLFVKNSGVR